MIDIRHVDADLVRAAGFDLDIEQRELLEPLPHTVQRLSALRPEVATFIRRRLCLLRAIGASILPEFCSMLPWTSAT